MHRIPESHDMSNTSARVPASIPLFTPVFAVGLSLSLITSGAFWNSGVLQPLATWSESRLADAELALQGVFRNESWGNASEADDFRVSEIRPRPATNTTVKAAPAVRSDPRQLSREQQTLAQFLAKRYRVAQESTQEFVELSYQVARDMKLDPWLILAIMGIESSFDPNAQSNKGAQGLMQVLTRVHADKFAPFGGVAAAFDPLANIKVGARILKGYIDRDGSIEAALKSYVGAAFMSSDSGYGEKVLVERERLAAVVEGRAMNVVTFKPQGIVGAVKSVAAPSIIELDGPAPAAAVERVPTLVRQISAGQAPVRQAPLTLTPLTLTPLGLDLPVMSLPRETIEPAAPRGKPVEEVRDLAAEQMRALPPQISDTTQ